MNPIKYAFGVLFKKILGFVVTKNGIQVDPSKIQAIVKMPPPINLHKVKSFQGCYKPSATSCKQNYVK
jgi:hypothetical protein